jgi:hypothetical protein
MKTSTAACRGGQECTTPEADLQQLDVGIILDLEIYLTL